MGITKGTYSSSRTAGLCTRSPRPSLSSPGFLSSCTIFRMLLSWLWPPHLPVPKAQLLTSQLDLVFFYHKFLTCCGSGPHPKLSVESGVVSSAWRDTSKAMRAHPPGLCFKHGHDLCCLLQKRWPWPDKPNRGLL